MSSDGGASQRVRTRGPAHKALKRAVADEKGKALLSDLAAAAGTDVETYLALNAEKRWEGNLPSSVSALDTIFLGGRTTCRVITARCIAGFFILCNLIGPWSVLGSHKEPWNLGGMQAIAFIVFFLNAAGIIANVVFGEWWVRTRQVERVVQWGIDNADMDAVQFVRDLESIGYVGPVYILFLFLIWVAVNVMLVADADILMWSFVPGAMGLAYQYSQNFYLCSLWAWKCLVVNRAFDHYINPHMDSLRDRNKAVEIPDAGLLLDLLQDSQVITGIWNVNHGIRSLLTVIFGTLHLIIFLVYMRTDNLEWGAYVFAVWMVCVSLISYIAVIGAAVIPGMVNDYFFYKVQDYLASAAESRRTRGPADCADECRSRRKQLHCNMRRRSMSVADRSERKTTRDGKTEEGVVDKADSAKRREFVVEATLMMQRAQCLDGKKGIIFLGAPAKLAWAFSAVSLIGFCIFNVSFQITGAGLSVA